MKHLKLAQAVHLPRSLIVSRGGWFLAGQEQKTESGVVRWGPTRRAPFLFGGPASVSPQRRNSIRQKPPEVAHREPFAKSGAHRPVSEFFPSGRVQLQNLSRLPRVANDHRGPRNPQAFV